MTNLRGLLLLTLLMTSGCTPLLVPVSPPIVAPSSGVDLGFVDQHGARLTLKVVNALAEPIIVDLGKAVLETLHGARAARCPCRLLMLPPSSTTVFDMELDFGGLHVGDLVLVSFEGAVRSSQGAVSVAPLRLAVDHLSEHDAGPLPAEGSRLFLVPR